MKHKYICEYCGKEYEVDPKLGNWDKSNNQIIIHKSHESSKVVKSKRFCCYRCGKIHKANKIKQTNLKKFGTEYAFQNEGVQEKIKKTNLKRYGCENVFQNKNIQEKIKKTNLKKYGTTNPGQLEEVKDKRKQTNLKKYGTEYAFQNEGVQEKIKKATIKKFGTDHYFKSQAHKNSYKNSEWLQNKQEKEFSTKKKNQSFNKSKPEEEIYLKLIEKFGKTDVERQYRSKKYPFNCDFYIRSLDLYIEYQGTWTHGEEPFDENNLKHQEILEKWTKRSQEINFENKKKNYYKIAIHIWTVTDPLKRQTAKDNNLNWIEFFNLNQFNNYFKLK